MTKRSRSVAEEASAPSEALRSPTDTSFPSVPSEDTDEHNKAPFTPPRLLPSFPEPSAHALTFENLAHHTNGTYQPAPYPAPDSECTTEPELASMASSAQKQVDPDDKLAFYGINYHSCDKLPPDLQRFINQTIIRPRDRCSPTTSRIYVNQKKARDAAERRGIMLLIDDLLFEEGKVPHLSRDVDMNLDRAYLPLPRTSAAVKDFGALEQPQPDTSYGYCVCREEPKTGGFLTAQQEHMLGKQRISTTQHFPFLTAQWKSQKTGGTLREAVRQSARDGAAIVNYLHHVFASAGRSGATLTCTDTIHFSICIDMYNAALHVHWREPPASATEHMGYYMETVYCAWLDNRSQVSELRQILRNLLDWAMTERLQNLVNIVEEIAQIQPRPASLVSDGSAGAPAGLPSHGSSKRGAKKRKLV